MTTIARILLRVPELSRAVAFWSQVLEVEGSRVSPGRHHFDVGSVVLVCYDPRADGDTHDDEHVPGTTQLYIAVDDLEDMSKRVRRGGGQIVREIRTERWGETSFWASDPFGHRLCFLARVVDPGRASPQST